MKDTIYLVLTKAGVNRMLKNPGSLHPKRASSYSRRTLGLKPGERAVRVDVAVDDRAFAPPGVGHVKIAIEEGRLSAPIAAVSISAGEPPAIIQPEPEEEPRMKHEPFGPFTGLPAPESEPFGDWHPEDVGTQDGAP
jgi:hypothetical protein